MRITEKEYLQALDLCKRYAEQVSEEIDVFDTPHYFKKLIECDASVRLKNAIISTLGREAYLGEIAKHGKEIIKTRNFGYCSLNELRNILDSHGIKNNL